MIIVVLSVINITQTKILLDVRYDMHEEKNKILNTVDDYIEGRVQLTQQILDQYNNSVQKDGQRTGYTTGSCAAAAATAALKAILTARATYGILISLPKQRRLLIPIKKCVFDDSSATCTVIKDGGDDPDVTHGAEIIVRLELTDNTNIIEITGGEGVGIVTKPGLGLTLNESAINPVPKKIIEENLRAEIPSNMLNTYGIKATIIVPKGKELGPKTDNPRLGIIGGISILGTSGIVIPFSTASYAASIRQNLDVAIAMGEDVVVLTTGGRSEEFAKKAIADLPDHCFIQMGDFVGYSVSECAKRSEHIKQVYVVGFIGKLAKMAKGVRQTHVKGSKVDTKFLANLAQQVGADHHTIQMVSKANTARHVLEIISETKHAKRFFGILCHNVYEHMIKHARSEKIPIQVLLFDFDGCVLAKADGN